MNEIIVDTTAEHNPEYQQRTRVYWDDFGNIVLEREGRWFKSEDEHGEWSDDDTVFLNLVESEAIVKLLETKS